MRSWYLLCIYKEIAMHTRIQKWGNSLAVRIPKIFADEINLEVDTNVEIIREGNKIIICPLRRPKLKLEDLLEGITEENRHEEIKTGPPVGREIW
jgi:antitoxin MazE